MQAMKLKGIILSETNYKESSKILSVYTKEKGKQKKNNCLSALDVLN